ncbi:hypothetical protein M440DRAFT_1264681 [Trichoderma longibrachiatum ATCC 18648]|uniref:Uncharacterized protein n=1 Tax=Trichoderma longibrachiatum ATCC 18648 TaxID=983965 RepID=A0A2T4C2Y9_TRILO|nr:hypothetical protein M440DRAFT_1264681 [Trichoderma longibrachiatum ATCC 18648]
MYCCLSHSYSRGARSSRYCKIRRVGEPLFVVQFKRQFVMAASGNEGAYGRHLMVVGSRDNAAVVLMGRARSWRGAWERVIQRLWMLIRSLVAGPNNFRGKRAEGLPRGFGHRRCHGMEGWKSFLFDALSNSWGGPGESLSHHQGGVYFSPWLIVREDRDDDAN